MLLQEAPAGSAAPQMQTFVKVMDETFWKQKCDV